MLCSRILPAFFSNLPSPSPHEGQFGILVWCIHSVSWKTTLSHSHAGAGDRDRSRTWGLFCSLPLIFLDCLLVLVANLEGSPEPTLSTAMAYLDFCEQATRFRWGSWLLLSSGLNIVEVRLVPMLFQRSALPRVHGSCREAWHVLCTCISFNLF